MPAPFVTYAFFFQFDIFCFFVKNHVFEGVWISIWVFYSVPLVLLSVFMLIPGCFQFYSEFEVRDVMPPEVFLLYRIVLNILGFLFFHMKLSTILSRSVKNFPGILMDITLNLYIAFGKVAYPRAWEIFPLSGVFFNFFLQRFKVLVIQVFHLFG